MPSADEIRQQVVRAAHLLFETGVMSHSGHGNISARIDGERLVVTSTSNIRNLSPERLAVVTLDGRVVEGTLDASTREIVLMHTALYREREDVGAVIHTHSPHVTAFALAGQPLPCAYEAMLRRGVNGPIPVAPWAPRGSRESVTNITDQVRSHPGTPAVLLGNHGLLAFTPGAVQTANLIVSLEEGAQMTLAARSLGGAQPLPADAFEREHARMSEFGTRPGVD
jgi:L-ribulose-5-phosphate 4-epimerase